MTLLLIKNIINRKDFQNVLISFRNKKLIKGAEIIDALLKIDDITEDIAEKILELLIGSNCLKIVGKITNLWSDLFVIDPNILDEILKNGLHIPDDLIENEEGIEKKDSDLQKYKKKLISETQKIEEISKSKETIPVLSIPYCIDFESTNIKFINQGDAFRWLIKRTKNEIKIISPFIDWWGLSTYIYDLKELLDKGVTVRLLTREDGKYFQTTINKLFSILDESNKQKVEVRIFSIDEKEKFTIHAKSLISDNEVGYIGSGEIRGSSLWNLAEMGILLKKPLITAYVLFFEQLWKMSKTIK